MVPEAILQLRSLFEKYAAIHPILAWQEIASIAWSESSGNPNAFNPHDPSRGLMGIEPLIAKAYGGVTDQDQLFDPDTNVRIGSAFLAYLKTQYASAFPNWMTAYNQGEGNLRKGYKDQPYWDAFNKHMAELSGE